MHSHKVLGVIEIEQCDRVSFILCRSHVCSGQGHQDPKGAADADHQRPAEVNSDAAGEGAVLGTFSRSGGIAFILQFVIVAEAQSLEYYFA